MSVYWMTQVWENSKVDKSTELLTFLAIADSANREGIAWPGVKKLAHMTRQTERNASRVIQDLAETGEIYIHRTRGKSNFYFIYINRTKEEAIQVLQKWFDFSKEQAAATIETLEQFVNPTRTPDKLSVVPPTPVSGTPDIAMSSDPLLTIYNKGADTDIRSTEAYRDLQNTIIGVCKKLNVLALKEEDVRNIDILFDAQVEPGEVRLYYSRDGQTSWWYSQFWKGKRGQFPTTQDIIDTIEQARSAAPNGTSSDAAFHQVLEWIRGERTFNTLDLVAIQAVKELGEYELKNKNPNIWANQFKKAYDKYNPDL